MTIIAAEPHVEANQSSGTSPPAETWEERVRSWCQHCESVEQLTHMIRAARGLQELAIAIDIVRECKNPGVALEVTKCL